MCWVCDNMDLVVDPKTESEANKEEKEIKDDDE